MIRRIGELYRNLVTTELKKKLSECPEVFLLNYHKMKSEEMTQLRKNLKAVGANILVTKNSFMRRVLQDSQKPQTAIPLVDGPMALVFVRKDAVQTSKVLVNFLKEHEALQIKGGFSVDRMVTLEDIKSLSKLPSKQAVYGQLASALNAPVGKLAVSLNQIVAKIAYALKAVSEKKK